jgi:hypothetical protein
MEGKRSSPARTGMLLLPLQEFVGVLVFRTCLGIDDRAWVTTRGRYRRRWPYRLTPFGDRLMRVP